MQADRDREDRDGEDADEAGERAAEIERRRPRLPRERRADRLGVARRARIAGQQFEQRGELRAAPDRGQRTSGGRRRARGR